MRVLFICKKRQNGYSGWGSIHVSSGLTISAKLVSDMLNTIGVPSKVVQVVDNNDIDREVHKFRPDVVIIEALWVVPEKFNILRKLYPHIEWIIRIHSEIPFLAHEGIAMQWLFEYKGMDHVHIGANSNRLLAILEDLLKTNILYLPNYYPVRIRGKKGHHHKRHHNIIDIACFGAIRPMKNQLIQALAAIKYADSKNKLLRFHINVNRIEQRGDGCLKNIRKLFDKVPHELVEHRWMDRDEFLDTIKKMDLGMMVSYTETYSVIAADFVASNIPVVGSPEVRWLARASQADPNDIDDIIRKIDVAIGNKKLALLNKGLLAVNSYKAKHVWSRLLKHGK